MRYVLFLWICITVIFISCKQPSTQPDQTPFTYDQMLFDREGGGNLVFSVSQTSSKDTFLVNVTENAYQDTSVQMSIIRNSSTAGLLDTLVQTLNGQIAISGSYSRDTIPTGTWVFIYMVKASEQTEVTNITLRNTLLEFEPIVRSKL
jgi:hypothetical protein